MCILERNAWVPGCWGGRGGESGKGSGGEKGLGMEGVREWEMGGDGWGWLAVHGVQDHGIGELSWKGAFSSIGWRQYRVAKEQLELLAMRSWFEMCGTQEFRTIEAYNHDDIISSSATSKGLFMASTHDHQQNNKFLDFQYLFGLFRLPHKTKQDMKTPQPHMFCD